VYAKQNHCVFEAKVVCIFVAKLLCILAKQCVGKGGPLLCINKALCRQLIRKVCTLSFNGYIPQYYNPVQDPLPNAPLRDALGGRMRNAPASVSEYKRVLLLRLCVPSGM
jgi:hypothetical protein